MGLIVRILRAKNLPSRLEAVTNQETQATSIRLAPSELPVQSANTSSPFQASVSTNPDLRDRNLTLKNKAVSGNVRSVRNKMETFHIRGA